MRSEFKERLALRIIALLKWPLIIFAVYIVFPTSLVAELSGFVKSNGIKKMQFTKDGVSFEVGAEQAIKNIKNAEELNQLANQLADIDQSDSSKANEVLKTVKSKTNEIINSTVSAYSSSLNRNIVIGDVMNSIAEFQYEIKRDKGDGVLLKVFIDKFPYSESFDLCSTDGNYKFLTEISVNNDKNAASLIYADKKVNCASSLKISTLKGGEFLYSFDLNFLDGFNIAKVQGFDAMLPKTFKRLRGNSVYLSGVDSILGTKYEKSKLVEQEVVRINEFNI